jgi:hypothetical protein
MQEVVRKEQPKENPFLKQASERKMGMAVPEREGKLCKIVEGAMKGSGERYGKKVEGKNLTNG